MSDRKILRRGLEILRQIEHRDALLEKILNEKKLPSIMTLFLSYYKVGQSYDYYNFEYDFSEWTDPKLKDGYGRILLAWTQMNTKNLLGEKDYNDEFGWLFSYNSLLEELENYKKKEEEWHEKGFIHIGNMAHWDIILLGMEPHNLEEIWVYGDAIWSCTGENYVKFGSNIFEFISRLEQFWVKEDLQELGIDPSRVYKSWGEYFWRVQEDKNKE